MCFGLRNAVHTFQRVINNTSILRGFDFAFAYIDDVLIASLNEQEHKHHVQLVLERCQNYPAKCIFPVDSLSYLGHTITKNACRPNPDRVSTINDWQLPTTKKSLQRFLASINFYRHFIPNAAEMQPPLYLLTTQVKKQDGPPK